MPRARAWPTWGSTGPRPSRSWRRSSGIDPSAGYGQAATEGRKLEEQVTRGGPRLHRRLHPRASRRSSWPRTCTGSTTPRASCSPTSLRDGPGACSSSRPRAHPSPAWETIELRPLTLDGRLALIDALAGRPARARTGSRSPRAATASRSTSRSWCGPGRLRASRPPSSAPAPGSVPAALYEPLVARLYATPAALPVAAAAAAAGQAGRSRRSSRHDHVDPRRGAGRGAADAGRTHRSSSRPGAATDTSSGTSCCARWRTSCSRRRGAARCTAGCATSCSATSPATGTCSRRTSSARSATTRRPRRTSDTAEWARRRGALEEARTHLDERDRRSSPARGRRGA